MRLPFIFRYPPPTPMAHIPNNSLSARMDVHMLDSHILLTAFAPLSRQRLDLHGVGAHEFSRQVAEHTSSRLIPLPSYLWPATAPRVRATNSSKAIFVT